MPELQLTDHEIRVLLQLVGTRLRYESRRQPKTNVVNQQNHKVWELSALREKLEQLRDCA